MVSFRRSPGSEHGSCVMFDVGSFRITSWSLLVHDRALLLLSLLFAYVSHHICLVLVAAPSHYPFLPISLNSLDLAGVRLLNPHDSQLLPNSCRCRWYQCRWHNRAQVGARWRSWSLLCIFSGWSIVVPSWGDWGSSIWGFLLLFWFRSWTSIVFRMMYVWLCYLCEVAIVSQLFIPFLFSIQDCVKITPLATSLPCGYASKSCPDTWEI